MADSLFSTTGGFSQQNTLPKPQPVQQQTSPSFNGISFGSSIGGNQTSTSQQPILGFGELKPTQFNPFEPNFLGDANTPKVSPTASGGIAFDSSLANGYNNPAKTLSAPNTQNNVSQSTNTGGDLSQYVNNQYTTPNGGTVTTSGGAGGNVTGFNPAPGYSINTSGSFPSSALGSNATANDVNQQQNKYQDYVNALAQAQGYSPEYIQALQQQQQSQLQGQQLGLNSATLNSNLYTGNNLPGDTLNYAQGATAKAQAQNTLQQAQNSIQQLSATQQMQVQALIRSGNISAAQSLVQASQPVGVSPGTSLVSPLTGQESYSGLGGLTAVNSLNQVNSLQQSHPDANIPSYDPKTMTPQQYQQLAMQAVAQSPSFQSSTPEGQANISSLVSQQAYLDTTTRSYQTATSNLGTLQNFMQSNGINQSGVPILNQIENKVRANIIDPGAIDAFKSSIAGLRAEYAQVLSRGGAVTDTERKEANDLIPDDLNAAQLEQVTKQLTTEGQNAINEAQSQVKTIQNRLTGNTQTQTGGTSNPDSWF